MGSEQSTPNESEKLKENDKKQIFRIMNVHCDIPDHRDYKYSLDNLEIKKIENKIDLRNDYDKCKCFNIKTKGCSVSACISTIIYNDLLKNGEEQLTPSINFIFYNSLLLEYGSNNLNLNFVKTSIRNTLKCLNHYGICSEEMYSFDSIHVPSKDCYNYGNYFNFKYFSVSNDLEVIKQILSNKKSVLCNVSFFTSFFKEKMTTQGLLDYPDEYDSILGMMTCVIVGYTDELIIMKSCFGDKWGDQGYFYISNKYLINLCCNFWIVDIFIDKKQKFGLNIIMDTPIKENHNQYINNNTRLNMFRGSVL